MFNRDVLTKILTKEQKDAGFYLEESEDNLFLKRNGELAPVAVWNSTKVLAVVQIVAVAENALQWTKAGATFEKPEDWAYY